MKNSNAEIASVGSRVPRDRATQSWPMVRLGDVCKFQRGLTYKKSDEVAQSDNIVLRSNNIDLDQGVLDLRELKCIREDLSVPEDKKVMPGSILMCMANGSKSHLGKVALVQDDLGYAFGGFMGLLVPEGIDSSYLYLALRSAPFKECIRKLQDGANINNLKFSDFCDFPIPLPPLSVQREIVARLEKELGEADALAAQFKEIAENADAEFKAELDETFKNVEGEKVRLGDVCEFMRRGKSPTYCESSPYPMFAQKCNQPTHITLEKCKFCESSKFLKFSKEYRMRDYDIVVNSTGTGTLGRVGLFRSKYLVPYGYEAIVADSHVMIVRPSEQAVPAYL